MRKKLQIYFPIISAVVLFYCTSKALSNEMSNKEYFPDNLSDMQSVWNKRGKGRNVGFSHFDKFSDFYSWILAETLLPLSKQFQILLFAEWLTVQEQLCLNSGLYTEHRLPHWQWFVSIYKCNKTKASDHNIFFLMNRIITRPPEVGGSSCSWEGMLSVPFFWLCTSKCKGVWGWFNSIPSFPGR